ncbi:hypothetical protein [Aureimonas sp. AU22]|uniref:DUF6894 family protein n=1 Tax=Aureimonas sp. AU22 TaxID=1638162 RepID=UPI000AE62DD8|nr:hypothetical protein [Aureimonas sp. AU22]
MPRYFFHVHTGTDTAIDHDGTELASLEDAVSEAVEDHLSFAIEALRRRQPLPYSYEIGICDAKGRLLTEVAFTHAIEALSAMGRGGERAAVVGCNR